MKKIKLATLALLLMGGICLTSCNKDDNGGDTPNNQPTKVEVTGITLDQTNIITNAGESTQLEATIAPDNATNKEITWESSDSKVVSVDANGKLTAESRGGTAVIIAKVGDKTATCIVDVIPEGMTITNGEVTAMDKTKIPADGILGIPAIVSKIGYKAFMNCTSLKGIHIPNSVTSMGESAFRICTSLKDIDIPNSVTDIGQATFSGCKALTSVKLPKELTNIKYGVFQYCISLTSIELPDSLTSIEGSAFSGCTALTSITIPANVTEIGDDSDLTYPAPGAVFSGCTALESIICMPTTPPTLFNNPSDANDNFENTSASLKIKVPADKVDAYKAAAGWSDVAGQIEAQ